VTHALSKLDTRTHPAPPAVTTCLTSMHRIRAALSTQDLQQLNNGLTWIDACCAKLHNP
jgi:hypothetical protein